MLEIMADQVQVRNCFNTLMKLGAKGARDFTNSIACDYYY